MSKQSTNSRLYIIYRDIVLVLCAMTSLIFLVWYMLNCFPRLFNSETAVAVRECAHSLVAILLLFLFLLVVGHLSILLYRMKNTKHSFVWLVQQQAIALFAPILLAVLIKLFSGNLDNELKDMMVGVCSGIVSSIIILVMDRKHHLADNIIKHIAWEYTEGDAEIVDRDASIVTPERRKVTQSDSNKNKNRNRSKHKKH